MSNSLSKGQVRVGQLFHCNAESSSYSCTLTYEDGRGPLLSVPYITDERRFDLITSWFERENLPASLVFWDNDGAVTVSGIRFRGHSGGSPVSLGRLSPDVTIFERPRKLKDEYRVRQLTSRIDGLNQFARFRSVEIDNSGWPVVATVNPIESVAWRHGGFSYQIRASAPWSGRPGQQFAASSGAVLKTRRFDGASPDEHVTGQWPLRALLILTFGTKLYWREHKLLDDQFPTWMLSGPPRQPQPVRVQIARTVNESGEPEPRERDFVAPMFRLSDIGSRGLHRWFTLYDDPIIRRAIEPAVEVINGISRFLEPRIMMTVIGLEAMGHYWDSKRRRREVLERQIERCIEATRMDWSAIGPNRGIAKAIAKTNNDLKHPDRPGRPDAIELNLVASLAIVIMRMQVFDLLRLPGTLRENFVRSNSVWNTFEMFRLNGVTIDQDGALVRGDVAQ